MSKISIVFRKDKKNKSEKAPINIRITKRGKIRYFPTGFSISQNDWDFEKNLVKTTYRNSIRVNNAIKNTLMELENKLIEEETKYKHISISALKSKIQSKSTGKFFPFAKEYLKKYEDKKEFGSHRHYKTIIKKFEDFIKNDSLLFEEIDLSLLKQFEQELRVKYSNSNSTVHSNLKFIKTIILSYIKCGNMSYDKNPFLNYKLKPDVSTRCFLTEDELIAIEKLEINPKINLYHHRNIYVFSAYACGLRISDILQLKWENFNDGKLNFRIQKTNEPLSVKIPNKAVEIINKYMNEKMTKSDYIFPLLKCLDESNRLHFFQSISSATAYTNFDLKEIAKLAEIKKTLTFHTARHTFATLALQKGMRIEYVSKLMGHKSIKETQIYAKIINHELDKAIEIFN
ncbi:MAG: site-specific integrase [Bacteroidota bacterium]